MTSLPLLERPAASLDSGAELAEVGSHRWAEWLLPLQPGWNLTSLREYLQERDVRNTDCSRSEFLSIVAGRGVIPYEEKGDLGNKKSDDLTKYKYVEPGDLVINSMNFQIGSYGVSPTAGITSQVYIVLKQVADSRFRRYCGYLLQVPTFQRFAQSFGNGILDHRRALKWSDLKNLRIPGPPASVAGQIADFLDRETAKIDALVEKKRRLIELLKEKRAALISRAVTKGLDPSAPMKDSGIPWIGRIPAHWSVRPLKHLAPERIAKLESKPDDALYVGLEHIQSSTGRLLLDDQPTVVDSAVNRFEPGDLLFAKLRPYLAKVALPEFHGVATTEAIVLKPSGLIDCRFLQYILSSVAFIGWINALAAGVKMPRVSPGQLASAKIPAPDSLEQKAITAFLNRETAKIDALVDKIERHIERLTEYRSALISAAVTGKIDVRSEAPR